MTTITDAIGSGPIRVEVIRGLGGRPTKWSAREPSPPTPSDAVETLDGKRENFDLNPRGSTKPLGALVRLSGDGPGLNVANVHPMSGKVTRARKAMERAKSGTLMLTVLENLEAQALLKRFRALYDLAELSPSVIPSPWGNHFRDIGHDNSVVDLKGEGGDAQFRFDSYQTDKYIKCGPTPERLVKNGAKWFQREIKKHPWLFKDRLVGVRGSHDARHARKRNLDYLRLPGNSLQRWAGIIRS
jgi:hypothetical protein